MNRDPRDVISLLGDHRAQQENCVYSLTLASLLSR